MYTVSFTMTSLRQQPGEHKTFDKSVAEHDYRAKCQWAANELEAHKNTTGPFAFSVELRSARSIIAAFQFHVEDMQLLKNM